MKRLFTALLLSAAATGAQADGCPVAPDHRDALDSLIEQIRAAPSQSEARLLNARMWEMWLDAPDGPSQAMLDEGLRARSGRDLDGALERFETLVNYCPFYAEGYNQRAFIRFLRDDHAAALPDLNRALEIDPRHIGALSGKALTLLRLGHEEEGQAVLREAVALNPWLSERFLLRDPPADSP